MWIQVMSQVNTGCFSALCDNTHLGIVMCVTSVKTRGRQALQDRKRHITVNQEQKCCMAYFCDVSMHSPLLQHVELVGTLNLPLQRK